MGTVMPECVFKFNWIPNVVCPEMRRGLTAQKFFSSVRKVFAVKTWPFHIFFSFFLLIKERIRPFLSWSLIEFRTLSVRNKRIWSLCILTFSFLSNPEKIIIEDRLCDNLVIQSPQGLSRWTHKLNSFVRKIF